MPFGQEYVCASAELDRVTRERTSGVAEARIFAEIEKSFEAGAKSPKWRSESAIYESND